MGTTSGVVLVLNFICIGFGVAGITAGIVGHSWWTKDETIQKSEYGLWRTCIHSKLTEDTICGKSRENVFKFVKTDDAVPNDLHLKYDIALMLLVCADAFATVAIITGAAMFCFQSEKGRWVCGSIILIIMSFIAGATALACLIYVEVEIKWEGENRRGWSVIAVWIGMAMLAISFVLSIITSCLAPKRSY